MCIGRLVEQIDQLPPLPKVEPALFIDRLELDRNVMERSCRIVAGQRGDPLSRLLQIGHRVGRLAPFQPIEHLVFLARTRITPASVHHRGRDVISLSASLIT